MSLSKIFVNNQDTGFEGIPLQETGQSTEQPMSQKAVTDALFDLEAGINLIYLEDCSHGYIGQSGDEHYFDPNDTKWYFTNYYIPIESTGTKSKLNTNA